MKKTVSILLLLFCTVVIFSQKKSKLNFTPPQIVPDNSIESDIFKNLKYRLIGPFRGGRSGSVTGSLKQKNTFYFGSVGGGVFKTVDGGNNWANITDKYFGGSIGAVAIAPSDETILYVGEGEHTVRGNVSEGLGGIWRSDDGGRSWKNLGLKDTRHIVKIVVHPKNPDVVWVAALGHLFGPNQERGIFKTTDGGKTWAKTLYVNDQTGASDLMLEPGNPQTLYAGTWRVIRRPYSMESGGDGSGLWKSTDGGETWKNLSNNHGLPKGVWGITGITVAPSNPDKVFALIENEKGGLFVSNDGGENFTLTCSDNNIRQRAWYYSRIFIDPKNENKVYCPNVNFMKSVDGGKTFTTINSTPHGDHHDFWVDPEDPNRMIVSDDGGAQISFDGGANFSTYFNQPTVQVYRLSADNAFPYRVLGAQQDNTAFRIRSRTYGSAITANDFQPSTGGESGFVVADPTNPDVVYGGNYMGTLERLDHKTNESRSINIWPDDGIGAGADVQKYRFQWNYPIFFSPNNPKRLYAAGNHLFVTENEGKSWEKISPDLTTNDKKLQAASGGPITKDNTGVEYFCTIFTATESDIEKDLLWTGSDDGLIYVSKNGGKNWDNVTPPNLPKYMMWNSVDVDPFKKGAAYFVGTRYKSDDYTPYIFKTEEYGKTWKKITNGINNMHFARVCRADKKVPGLLYAGTEYGMYISRNDGESWVPFQLNLPKTPVTDLLIKNNDLIVGTQGRSIYILDDLSMVQQWSETLTGKAFHVFTPAPAYRMQNEGRRRANNEILNVGMNPPSGVVIPYLLNNFDDSTKVSVTLFDKNKKEIKTFSSIAKDDKKDDKLEPKNGLNYFNWNLNYADAEKIPEGNIVWNGNVRGPVAPPGNYFARFKVNKDSAEIPFTIIADPNYKISQAEYDEQHQFLMSARDKFSDIIKTLRGIKDIRNQMTDYQTRLGKDCPKEVKTYMDSVGKMMTPIEEALHQTKAKSSQDVLNYPIRLDDKLSGLYNVASNGNTVPSQQVKETYEVLRSQIDEQLQKFDAIKKNNLPVLNALIREKSLPIIMPKE